MASVQFGLKEKGSKQDSWKYRRLFMLWQMVFCKAVIIYVLLLDLETKVAATAVDFSFMVMGTIILAYVFGATLEDINKVKLRK